MKLEEIMKNKKVIITDGGMGTYLEKLGYKGKTPELAVLEAPDMIKKIHSEYIKSGAEVILTDTFGANRLRLAKKGIEEKIMDINSKAVKITLEAKGDMNIIVAGDIGPTGELLEPYGNLTPMEAGKVFLQQAEILKEAGADFILLETFQDLEEIKIAFYSIRERLEIPVLPSVTLISGENQRTLMGQKLEDIVSFAERENLVALGVNCGVSSRDMIKIVRRLKDITDIYLWIKPNAGVPHLRDGNKIVYPESIEEFVDNCLEMVACGIKFIGGCCGTTPEYISSLKDRLNENC